MLRSVISRCLASFIALAAVDAGFGAANDSNHWAYQPLSAGTPPSLAAARGSRNPLDAFLRARLAAAGLKPAPEADRRTLLRRIYFDLVGLPPTPDDFAAFLSDSSPDAYERAVDRLLASPRHGERWARHWMDAVHFAETHGHDQDRIRTNAWPYRDYLIAAFNDDKPYPQFIEEQVAGDVLFPNDPGATVALGFVAAGPWDESSLRDIREDTLDRQIARYIDRDDMVATVMNTICSTTVQCARCHDHKFDPVPQRDYYALQAVFAGVDRANRAFDWDPAVHATRRHWRAVQRRVERDDPSILSNTPLREVAERWVADPAEKVSHWIVLDPQRWSSASGTTLTKQEDHSLLASGPCPDLDTYSITAVAPGGVITGFRLETLADPTLPHGGPGRAENGNLHLSEVELLLREPGATQSREIALTHPTADFNQDDWTIDRALDGNEATAWGIHPMEGALHQAVFELKEPLLPPPGASLVFVLKQLHGRGHLIGRPRISVTRSTRPIGLLPAEVEGILRVASSERSASQRWTIAKFAIGEKARGELAALPPPSLVYAAASDFEPDAGFKPGAGPRPVQILRRGEITKPGEAATPGALSCLTALPARFVLPDADDEGARRCALARWLAARENPLTWRSIVNRVWAWHFGQGIVETPNDFGRMGGAPSHPELLDWLAIWFRDEARGSLKALHRLIVTSAAYRQAAGPPAQADPNNRLLSHMNRIRLDAECVRDAVLQMSDRMDWRMGGPSDRQFDLQPGVHVTPRVNYAKFDADSDAGRRRSVYRFLFRTLPDPFMEALDCPSGDQLTAARANSVTVQQALALWNGALVIRNAEHFASRLEAETPQPDRRISRACELAWGRPPVASEARALAEYTRAHGLANLCRLLLNSNEFMFVN